MGIKYIFNPTTGSLDAVSVETPAGADTEIQFNNAGVFGADSDLTWDDTSTPKVLGVGGDISPALGTAAAPSIAFTGDLNTGIYSPGADQVAVATNGTGRLFVDASGNIGLGTASPTAFVQQRVQFGSASEQFVLTIDACFKRPSWYL